MTYEPDKGLRHWENSAALGLCGWICSDCCMTFPEGMPKTCPNKAVDCDEILTRDHARAQLSIAGDR